MKIEKGEKGSSGFLPLCLSCYEATLWSAANQHFLCLTALSLADGGCHAPVNPLGGCGGAGITMSECHAPVSLCSRRRSLPPPTRAPSPLPFPSPVPALGTLPRSPSRLPHPPLDALSAGAGVPRPGTLSSACLTRVPPQPPLFSPRTQGGLSGVRQMELLEEAKTQGALHEAIVGRVLGPQEPSEAPLLQMVLQ